MINQISDKIVFSGLKLIKYGKLNVTTFQNKNLQFGDDGSLEASIKINKPDFSKNIISKGSVGLAESYMRGDFETDDLSKLIELSAKNIKLVHKFSGVLDLTYLNYFKKFINRNTKTKSKEHISKHYDLGNEFFSLWLDDSLTYSSAIFENEKSNLYEAQINKYKKLSNLLKPKTGDKLLEIGCGWGGFAEYIGKNHDVNLDCITISKKQYEFAKKRIHDAGLNEKINIQMKDYRDVKQNYNSIASIEMIEAVGKDYLKNYFQTIKKNLVPGGKAAIQAITIDDNLYNRYKRKEDFIQKYIFPGGFLPSINFMEKLIKKNNLKLEKINTYSDDYARTLSTWRKNFLGVWDKISPLGFDDYFKRMWEFYLSYCEGGFKSRNINLIQFSMSNKYSS